MKNRLTIAFYAIFSTLLLTASIVSFYLLAQVLITQDAPLIIGACAVITIFLGAFCFTMRALTVAYFNLSDTHTDTDCKPLVLPRSRLLDSGHILTEYVTHE